MQSTESQTVPTQDTRGNTKQDANRPQRQQRAPDATLLTYSGKVCAMYADHLGRPLLAVIPTQKVSFITDLYPIDMAFLFNEVRMFCEHYRIRNYTIRVHRRDWEFSQHCHLQVTMPRVAYDIVLREIGIARPASSDRGPRNQSLAPTSAPPPPAPSPTSATPPPAPSPTVAPSSETPTPKAPEEDSV